MLHYPSFPDGHTLQVGDIFTFDGGTQVGIITQVYPDEACYQDAAIENAVDDDFHTPVCDEDLSDRDIPGACTLVPHWQQIAYWELQQGTEVTCCKKSFLHDDALTYIGTLDLKAAADKLHRHLKCGYYKEDMRNVQGWLRRARKEMKP